MLSSMSLGRFGLLSIVTLFGSSLVSAARPGRKTPVGVEKKEAGPCEIQAGLVVWDSFCERTRTVPVPNETLWSGGMLATTWRTTSSIHERVRAEVGILLTKCSHESSAGKCVAEKRHEALLAYWFEHGDTMCASDVQKYFGKTQNINGTISTDFGTLHAEAMLGELDEWACCGGDHLVALVILYDQLTRNLGRCGYGSHNMSRPKDCLTTPNVQMYSGDAKAQAVALFALESGKYSDLSTLKKQFLHLVFTHSENWDLQALCVVLTTTSLKDPTRPLVYKGGCEGGINEADYISKFTGVWTGIAYKHFFVVDFFGRQPHRNEYAPTSYYTDRRTKKGWLPVEASAVRLANTGRWARKEDAEPIDHYNVPYPVGWSLRTNSLVCESGELVGEFAFEKAAPFQFNDIGLPSQGDGISYDAACRSKEKLPAMLGEMRQKMTRAWNKQVTEAVSNSGIGG